MFICKIVELSRDSPAWILQGHSGSAVPWWGGACARLGRGALVTVFSVVRMETGRAGAEFHVITRAHCDWFCLCVSEALSSSSQP